MPEDVKTKRKFTSKKSNEISPNDVVATEYGKMPPNDVPLEEAVLGALMLESNAFGSVSDFLKPDCFTRCPIGSYIRLLPIWLQTGAYRPDDGYGAAAQGGYA